MYCLVNMHMYRIHAGFNTTSSFIAFFYFLYFPPLPRYQLWGFIIKIDCKANIGSGVWGGVMTHNPGRDIFSDLLKHSNFFNLLNLRLLRWDYKSVFDFSNRLHTTYNMLYENISLSWIYWIFHMLSENNYW